MKWQYFSKWRKEWRDFGFGDSVEEYKKYKYQLRQVPIKENTPEGVFESSVSTPSY